MKNNFQRLGTMLSDRMKKTSNAAVPLTTELGIINANMSLTTDSLQAQIPKGDYMVSLALTSRTETPGAELPSAFRELKAGDRVLVAWCGNEPVVIAIVVSS